MKGYEIGDVVFDGWRITRRIGAGASGVVYEINKNDRGVELTAAVKVVRIPQDPVVVNQLMSEGMTTAEVTTYLDSVVDELTNEIKIMISMKGFPYVVGCEDCKVIRAEEGIRWDVLIRMELLTPVNTYWNERRLTEADVRKMGIELTKALALFEKQGIIHRDIKPDNIFVNAFGDYKVGDFGVARVYEKACGDLSKKGTENYMAPEVFQGKECDFTVDQYSLGLVLYKALNNNRLPFYPAGAYTEMHRQQAMAIRLGGKQPVPAPEAASPEFARIVMRMCAYDPADRYPTAEALLKDLEALRPSDAVILDRTVAAAAAVGAAAEQDRTSFAFSGFSRTAAEKKTAQAAKKEEVSDPVKPEAPKEEPVKPEPVKPEPVKEEPVKPAPVKADPPKPEPEKPKPAADDGKPRKGDTGKSQTGKGKEKNSTKRTIQILVIVAVIIAIIFPVLRNMKFTLTVENGVGDGEYTGGAKVNVEADEREGWTFTGWKAEGMSLSDEERASMELSLKMPRKDVTLTATYEQNLYALTVNGGTGSGEYALGETITIEADAPAEGYRFERWEKNAGDVQLSDNKAAKTSFVMEDAAVEVTAVYVPESYELVVKGANGGGTYDFGEEVTLTAGEVLHQTFTCWEIIEGAPELTEEQLLLTEITFPMPAGKVQLSAVYTVNSHPVTVNGGSGSGTYQVGDTVEIIADAAEEGYRFDRWEKNAGFVTLSDNRAEKVTFVMGDEAVEITAQFVPMDYVLVVNGAEGSGEYAFGDTVRLNVKDVRSQTFNGWTVNEGTLELTQAQAASKSLNFKMPACDLEITAQFSINTHAVTVVGGAGSGVYAVGDEVEITANAPEAGYRFDSWTTNNRQVYIDSENMTEAVFTMPDAPVEVKANYKPETYTLAVEGAEGSGQYSFGSTVRLVARDIRNQTFAGWRVTEGSLQLSNEQISAKNLSFAMPASDVQITAVYSVNTHTVTVVGGSGTGVYSVGDEVDITANLPETGYAFKTWTTTSRQLYIDDTGSATTYFTMPDADVVVTAEYEPVKYTLTINGGNGSGQYTMGEIAAISADPMKEGMMFSHWTVDRGTLSLSDMNQLNIAFSMPAGDLTMTAHYKVSKFTVKVKNGRGSGMYSAGQEVTITAEATDTQGRTFGFWSVESGTLVLSDEAKVNPQMTFAMPESNVELKANYTQPGQPANTGSYTLWVNGGSGSGKYKAGDTVTIVADTPMSGMRFGSWIVIEGQKEGVTYTEPTLTFTMPAADVTVIAVFEQK